MLTNKKTSLFSPLTLAYIGDAVYEIFVRTRVIEEHENMPPNKLHRISTTFVKARAQTNSINAMLPYLTEEERDIYKRGRNAKSYTKAKNADTADYRKATGFETLIGYLYLDERQERLNELMQIAYDNAHNDAGDTLNNEIKTREEI